MIIRFDPYLAPELHGSSWAFADGYEGPMVYKDNFLRLYTSTLTEDEDEARAEAIPKFKEFLEQAGGKYEQLVPYLYLPDVENPDILTISWTPVGEK